MHSFNIYIRNKTKFVNKLGVHEIKKKFKSGFFHSVFYASFEMKWNKLVNRVILWNPQIYCYFLFGLREVFFQETPFGMNFFMSLQQLARMPLPRRNEKRWRACLIHVVSTLSYLSARFQLREFAPDFFENIFCLLSMYNFDFRA